MAGGPRETESNHEVVCPHCSRSFQASLLSGTAERYQGFKCPHCRLFVALKRVEGQVRAEPQ
jgi:transposase-like protein